MEEHRQSNSQAEGRGFKSHRPLQLELAGDTGFSPCPLLRSCRFRVGVETLQGFSWSIREEDRDDENQLEQTHHYLHLGFPNTSVGGFRPSFLGFQSRLCPATPKGDSAKARLRSEDADRTARSATGRNRGNSGAEGRDARFLFPPYQLSRSPRYPGPPDPH